MSNDSKCGALRFGQFYSLGSELSAVKVINGSSLTIPGQARDLASLLASAKFQGGMLPRHGSPEYDEDFAHGLARSQYEQLDDEEISAIAQEAAAGVVDKEEHANDEETEQPDKPDEQ